MAHFAKKMEREWNGFFVKSLKYNEKPFSEMEQEWNRSERC